MKLTLSKLFLLVIIITSLLIILSLDYPCNSDLSKQHKCLGNLSLIGRSLGLYKLDFGREINYPPRDGAGFLVFIYQKGSASLIEDKDFICPGTSDKNENGRMLEYIVDSDKNEENYVSYAGRKNRNQDIYPGLFIPTKDTTYTTVAADDSQGTENHEEVINFLYLDGHTESVTKRWNESKIDWLRNPLTN